MPKYRGVGRISFNVTEIVRDALEKASLAVEMDNSRGFRTGAHFEVEFEADDGHAALAHGAAVAEAMRARLDPLFQLDGIDVREAVNFMSSGELGEDSTHAD